MEEFLTFATQKGKIKKTSLEEYRDIRRSGLIALKLVEDDQLLRAHPTSGKDEIMLITSKGKSIRFSEDDIRPTGRATIGVRGIKLAPNDKVVSMQIIPEASSDLNQLLVITEKGYGKKTPLKEYSPQGRGGQGVYTAKIKEKTGEVVDGQLVSSKDEECDLLIISEEGKIIRLPLKEVPEMGRHTQGVRLIKLASGDSVASLTLL